MTDPPYTVVLGPLPPPHPGRKRRATSPVAAIAALAAGTGLHITGETVAAVRSFMHQARNDSGKAFTVRKRSDGSFVVWCTSEGKAK